MKTPADIRMLLTIEAARRPTPSQTLGRRVHAAIEHYLRADAARAVLTPEAP